MSEVLLVKDNKHILLEIYKKPNGIIRMIMGPEIIDLTADQSVDLATKIINHCYPFTRPERKTNE